ncbi:27620_t:CDS:2 [Dentiscutata erythropus]|uniref:27620_t:CDS:1 n=1 Tax=Dentiscutata erythropus TaxID=1348616 RepID=A0A9N9HEW7_9GLOM|nr:27620_t:CDS:2 [Dentiscutata erythropus]
MPFSGRFYLSKNKIRYISAHSHNGTKYKIPDNYIVQTRLGQGKSLYVIECEVKYETDGPIFIISFEENGQNFVVESKEFVIKVANEYTQKRNPDMKAKIFGVHVFGLNIIEMEQETTIQYELLHNYEVLDSRKKINDKMNQKVSVSVLNITNISLVTTSEPSDINNQEIEEDILVMRAIEGSQIYYAL